MKECKDIKNDLELPLVSVVLPFYQEDLSVAKEAINSILNQTYKRLEIILIFDDPVNYELKSAINDIALKDDRVIYILNKTNIGLASSLNKGIKLAKGKYIVRMDGDDISILDRIDKQVDFMEKNSIVDISGMYAKVIDDKGENIGVYKKPISHEIIKKFAKYATPILHPTWIVKKGVFSKLGYYDDFSPAQDYGFLIKALEAKLILANIPHIGLYYRKTGNSLSRKNFKKSLFTSFLLRKAARAEQSIDVVINVIKNTNFSGVSPDF